MENQETLIDIVINDRTFTGRGANIKLAKTNASKQVVKEHINKNL